MMLAAARGRFGAIVTALAIGLAVPSGYALQSDRAKGTSAVLYHGNRESRVFHAPGCQFFNCKNCTAVFKSKEEAAKAGYRPHAGRASCVR